MDQYYTTSNYFTRPYKVPIHSTSSKIPWDTTFLSYVKEGDIAEYIAYSQGLPVTFRLVQSYIDMIGSKEEIKEIKSFGNVHFICNNGTYDTNLVLAL